MKLFFVCFFTFILSLLFFSCIDHLDRQQHARLKKVSTKNGFFNSVSSVSEFTYDNLNRLVLSRAYSTSAPASVTIAEITYDDKGRITRIDQRYKNSISINEYGKQLEFSYGPTGKELIIKTYRAASNFGDFQYEYEQRIELNEKGQVVKGKRGNDIESGTYISYEYIYENNNIIEILFTDYFKNAIRQQTRYSYLYVVSHNPYFGLIDSTITAQLRYSINNPSQITIQELNITSGDVISTKVEQFLHTISQYDLPIETNSYILPPYNSITIYKTYEYEMY